MPIKKVAQTSKRSTRKFVSKSRTKIFGRILDLPKLVVALFGVLVAVIAVNSSIKHTISGNARESTRSQTHNTQTRCQDGTTGGCPAEEPQAGERLRSLLEEAVVAVVERVNPEEERMDPTDPMATHPPSGGGGAIGEMPKIIETDPDISPNASPCASHDSTAYHGLWNSQLDCYYDHTHGVNPNNTIFANYAGNWGVSYPWQTPNENEIKHKGYLNLYTEAQDGCEQFSGFPGANDDKNCVTHVLYQVHSIGTTMAMRTRFHSYRYVARICDKDNPSICGIISGGGWADYGTLHCPYKQAHCALDTDPINPNGGPLPDDVAFSQPPYRAVAIPSTVSRQIDLGRLSQFWNNQQIALNNQYYPDAPNEMISSAWSFSDGWGWIDPDNMLADQFVCMDGSCHFNHSRAHMWTFVVKLPSELGSGILNYDGYTNRHGHIVSNCTQAGVDCVPLHIDGVPAGTAILNRAVRQNSVALGDPYEFDICFNSNNEVVSCEVGETSGWIKPTMMGM